MLTMMCLPFSRFGDIRGVSANSKEGAVAIDCRFSQYPATVEEISLEEMSRHVVRVTYCLVLGAKYGLDRSMSTFTA